jgi:hypothetical protein
LIFSQKKIKICLRNQLIAHIFAINWLRNANNYTMRKLKLQVQMTLDGYTGARQVLCMLKELKIE